MNNSNQNESADACGNESKADQSSGRSVYELPTLDDILTDDESRKLILRRSNKPVRQSSAVANEPLLKARPGAVLKTYVVEMRIEHVAGSEVDFDPEIMISNSGVDGVRLVSVRLKGGAPAPSAAPVRVHRVGAPRKWNDDALAEASRALPPVLSQEQKRQRRRAQVAAASRRLRERRKFGDQGDED